MGWQTEVAEILIAGNTTIINQNGEFQYNGPPAANNLIYSNALASGTDQFGNLYLAGVTQYVHRLASPPGYYAIQMVGTGVNIFNASSEAGPWSSFGSMGYDPTVLATFGPGMRLTNAISAAGLEITTAATYGAGSDAAAIFQNCIAVTSDPNGPPVEKWHPLTLLNGWVATSGGFAHFMMAEDGHLLLGGALNGGAATSANIASLSNPYRPQTQNGFAIGCNAGVLTGQSPFVQLTPGGTLFTTGLTPGTTAQSITLDGKIYLYGP